MHSQSMDPKVERRKDKSKGKASTILRGEAEAALQAMVAPHPSTPSTSSSALMATVVAAAVASPPPSSASSPSHDFTFTISLFPSPPKGPNKSPSRPRNLANAIDLAPADDIFFQGHLLPLRLLTRPPFSPRRSAENITISFNNYSTAPDPQRLKLPGNDLAVTAFDGGENIRVSKSSPALRTGISKSKPCAESQEKPPRDKDKITDTSKTTDTDKDKDKKKKKFDMKRMLKRYAALVETLLFSRGAAREKRRDLRQRPCSFSGVPSRSAVGGGGSEEWRRRGKKRWGEFSAPASMRTSPTNSGLLVAPSNLGSSEESTMEELQSAIQAAIAHCKNSMNVKQEGGAAREYVNGGRGIDQ